MAGANRMHKDTVFRDLFGSEERKGYALELYNALNGTDYEDPTQLRLTTVDNALYLGMRNDVSFVIDECMSLWEHQSTFNPNMPLRALLYFASLYSKELDHQDVDLFVHSLIRLPRPQYYVFYNGVPEQPETDEMCLSDAFDGGGCVEVVAKVVNINEGKSPELAAACKTLAGYSHLMALIRKYNGCMELREAVDRAVDECIAEGILEDYLRERRAEVVETYLTQWDAEKSREILRREAAREGHEQGRAEGYAEGIEQGIERGIERGIEHAAERLREMGVSEEIIASIR